MSSLRGSFPNSLTRLRKSLPGGRLPLLLLGALLAAVPAFAEMPAYLRAALGKFSAEIPPGWAYTLKTERDGRQTVERYDPTRPSTEQWTLLLSNGRPPTEEELAKYFKYKAGQSPGAMQSNFQKSDIEPGSITLVSEDAGRAEFTCAFREQSTHADKMLGHLGLHLTVCKQPAYVEKFTLELREPYSPVLWVKMRELVVEMGYAPPADGRPSLPSRSSSHFVGRIFLIRMEENLRFTYSDFAPPP